MTNDAGQPFSLDVRTTAGADNETEANIIAADLSKLGMQMTQTVALWLLPPIVATTVVLPTSSRRTRR